MPSTGSSSSPIPKLPVTQHLPSKSPRWITVIGYSGCGKSTLAMRLASLYSLPVLHLDNVHWYDDWAERQWDEENWIVRTFMQANEGGWIIDGDYFSVASERFGLSELTVLLDYGRWWCWWSCFKRWREWRGRSRGNCPCIEKFDFAFQKWILWDSRGKDIEYTHKRIMENGRGLKLRFKSRKELVVWLERLERRKAAADEDATKKVVV